MSAEFEMQSVAGAVAPLNAVAELQGIYGPFSFHEKLLQKIWLRGDFDRARLVATDGRRVTVLHAGRWNLLGGPDFSNARLRFGEEPEITGDVELHLHASDWAAHGHARDRAYDGVRLHVVLFPPRNDHVTRGADGRAIPVVALLPLLHHDLEEYAADEAVEGLANRPASQIMETLGVLPGAELATLLERHARARWTQKVHFARLRVQRLGWSEACHQTAMEILGYRFNRAPMLRVATAHPLDEWAAPIFSADVVFESEREGWSLHGLRPANHPRQRLRQYAMWVRARPDWPERLRTFAQRLPRVETTAPTGDVRRVERFTLLRRDWAQEICADAVGGTRFDNLVCDGFLPLLATLNADEGEGTWHHWFAGDLPPVLPRALRDLGVFGGRQNPACHGAAQGLLGWLLERERCGTSPQGRGA
jgi:hypothetical protein